MIWISTNRSDGCHSGEGKASQIDGFPEL